MTIRPRWSPSRAIPSRARAGAVLLLIGLAPLAYAEERAPQPVAGSCSIAGDAAASISREIDALRALAGDGKALGPDGQGQIDQAVKELSLARAALDGDRAYAAIDYVERVRSLLEPIRKIESVLPRMKDKGSAAFDAERGSVEAELLAQKRALGKPSSRSLPAVVRALRDAARVQAPVYWKTVDAWRDIDTPDGALYYLADAVALARGAAFLASLPLPRPPGPPRIAPMEPAFDGIERALMDAYKPPASVDHHPDFIRASAAIKSGRELLEQDLGEGALRLYLQATIASAPLLHPERAPRTAADLSRSTADLAARVSSAAKDESIACLYWEKARILIELAEKGQESETNLRLVTAILEDALPEYFRLTGGG